MRQWVWKTFTRGHHPIFMDSYDSWSPDCENYGEINPVFNGVRQAMGDTLGFSQRFADLARMVPSDVETECSTTYCLRNVGVEYLVYLPDGSAATVDLSGASGEFRVEWFDPVTGEALDAGTVAGGADEDFLSPFDGDAVLYLHAER